MGAWSSGAGLGEDDSATGDRGCLLGALDADPDVPVAVAGDIGCIIVGVLLPRS